MEKSTKCVHTGTIKDLNGGIVSPISPSTAYNYVDVDTYRYPPILAFMLQPNLLFHSAFGKVLFCVMDLVAGVLVWSIVSTDETDEMRSESKEAQLSRHGLAIMCTALWLFNPLTVSKP